MFLFLITPSCNEKIQAVKRRRLECIPGLNRSRLDWGLHFKFSTAHHSSAPSFHSAEPPQTRTAPFQIFIWCQTWKSRGGALCVVSWSCRRAGAVASSTAAKQNVLQLYRPSALGRRPRVLPPPPLPHAAWHSLPALLLSTRQLLEGCVFSLILRSFSPKRRHKLVFSGDENLPMLKHIQGLFSQRPGNGMEVTAQMNVQTSINKLFLLCFGWKGFSKNTQTHFLYRLSSNS